jgi:hypothetical protein
VDDLGRSREGKPLGSWSGADPFVLDNFAYTRFSGDEAPWDLRDRRRWLEQTSDFQYGAWRQLIDFYRRQGEDELATRASIAMHDDRRRRGNLPRYRRVARYVFKAVMAYGYRPWYAIVWAAAIVAVFALIVWHWPQMFVPERQGRSGSPQPVAYAGDTFLPIIDLGEAVDWRPTGWVRWVEWV